MVCSFLRDGKRLDPFSAPRAAGHDVDLAVILRPPEGRRQARR